MANESIKNAFERFWEHTVDKISDKADINHTHNYAGSSSAGGSATSAVKLDTATAGDASTPVYFSGGKPVACTSLDLNTTGSSASCTGNSATATKATQDGSGNVITSTYVNLTGAQTVSGVKTFSNGIKIGSATLTYSSDDGALVISFA